MEMKPIILAVLLFFFLAGLFWILRMQRKVRLLESFRRDFVVNISHEFRTPLSVIKGYSETLLQEGLDPETRHSFLKIIEEHTEKLIQMVEELLQLSRLETIDPAHAVMLIHLPDFLENLRRNFQRRLEEHQIAWQVTLIPPLENFESDPKLLEMIFGNLIDNAIKYSNPGGSLQIRGERQGNTAQFTVADRGIGIAPGDQARIFERFYRAHKDRGREPGGTGLGLSIVKHAVQSLGGRIWLESEPGKGSKFHFTVKEAS